MQVNVTGKLLHPNGFPIVGAVVSFSLEKTAVSHREIAPKGAVISTTTNASGFYGLFIKTTDQFITDVSYTLDISVGGRSILNRQVYIPAKPTVDLQEILEYQSLNGKNLETFPLPKSQTVLKRFAPKYWMVEGSKDSSFSVVSKSANSLRLDANIRRKSDRVRLIWNSRDTQTHSLLSYLENTNYRNIVWDFDVVLSDGSPVLEDPRAVTINFKGRNSQGNIVDKSVPLKYYATSGGVRAAHIRIDFNTITDVVGNPFSTIDLDTIYFEIYSPNFNVVDNYFYPTDFYTRLDINNSTITGSNSNFYVSNITVPFHELGITTNYDDLYNQTPQRVIENIYALGYREFVNHSLGTSRYFNISLEGGAMSLDLVRGPINKTCEVWHSDFFSRSQPLGLKIVNGISYELPVAFCPPAWVQREWYGAANESTSPTPTYLISPINSTATNYLADTLIQVSGYAVAAALTPYVQIEKAFWKVNSNGSPCVYDATTKAAYTAQTGETPYYFFKLDLSEGEIAYPPIGNYVNFLRNKLGAANQAIRTRIRNAIPTAKVSVLLSIPEILDFKSGVFTYINYPKEAYSSPNFDFIQTECFEWVMDAALGYGKAELGYNLVLPSLGYSQNLIHYTSGYVPLPSVEGWSNVFQSIKNGSKYNIGKRFIAGYPQVMRDSITYLNLQDVFYFNHQKVQIFRGGKAPLPFAT